MEIGGKEQQYDANGRVVCFGFLIPKETKLDDSTIYIQKRQRNGKYAGEATSSVDFKIRVEYPPAFAEDFRKRADSEELKMSYEDFVKMIIKQNKVSRLERKFHADAEVEDIDFREFVRSSGP